MYVFHLKFAANTDVSKATHNGTIHQIYFYFSFFFQICFLLLPDGKKNATLELFHKPSQMYICYARAKRWRPSVCGSQNVCHMLPQLCILDRTNTFNFRTKKNVAVLLIAKKLYFHNVKNTLQAGWATVCSGKYNNKWKLLLLLVEAFAEVITQERMQIFVYGRMKK